MMLARSDMTTRAVRAVLLEVEGVATPTSFITQALEPLVRERLRPYIAAHAEDLEIEEALEETGRLMGGFDLKPEEAAALLWRWMLQGRKATPLKTIQGRIWQEGFEAGALTGELHADVAGALETWVSSGLRLFGYSSASALGQKLLFGDLADLFEGFFDTSVGQKMEPASYRAISERLDLPGGSIIVVANNEEELEAARAAGLATAFISPDGGSLGGHPAYPDLASLKLG
jgi:enolase-phosphatase E1